jgi:hypothetical protein
MDLLHAQFNSGRLSLAQVKTVLGTDHGSAWPVLQEKFKKDENDKYYNEKAEQVQEKRKKYSESRRNNLKKAHMAHHMMDHMEIENETDIGIKEQIQLSEKLLVDAGFFNTLAMNWGIDRPGFESMVQAFEVTVTLTNKKHTDYIDYRLHFFNWGAKRFSEYLQKQTDGPKKMVY